MKPDIKLILFLPALMSIILASCGDSSAPAIKNPGIYISVKDSITGSPIDSAIIRTCYSFETMYSAPKDTNWMVYPNPAQNLFYIYYKIDSDTKYKRFTISDTYETELFCIYEGIAGSGEYKLTNYTFELGDNVKPNGFYYINCDTGSLKTKKVVMFYADSSYIINGLPFSLILGSYLTETTGDTFIPYNLFPLSESAGVIQEVNNNSQLVQIYRFRNEALVDISRKGYQGKQIIVPLAKTKVYETEVKLMPITE